MLELFPAGVLETPPPTRRPTAPRDDRYGAAQPRATKPLSTNELAAAVAADTAAPQAVVVAAAIEQLRAPGPAPIDTPALRQLQSAIESALALPNGFFEAAEGLEVTVSRARLLRVLLAQLGLSTLAICRVRGFCARAQLRELLRFGLADDDDAHHSGTTPVTPSALSPEGVAPESSSSVERPTTTAATCHDQAQEDPTYTRLPNADDADTEVNAMADLERSEHRMREFCSTLLGDLNLGHPLTPELLCQALSARRGRRIALKGADLGSTTSTGHLIARRNSDLIIYEAAAPQRQKAHVIYHEIMHLVRGHVDPRNEDGGDLTCGTLLVTELDAAANGAPADATGRGSLYTDVQEWEAEAGATILSDMSRDGRLPTEIADRGTATELGLAGAFGLSTARWS